MYNNYTNNNFTVAKARKEYALKLIAEKRIIKGFNSMDQFQKIFKKKVDGIVNDAKIRVSVANQERVNYNDLFLDDDFMNPENSEWYDITNRNNIFIKCCLNTDNLSNWKGTSLAKTVVAYLDKIKGYKIVPVSSMEEEYKIVRNEILVPRRFFKDKEGNTKVTVVVPYSLNKVFPGFMEVFA